MVYASSVSAGFSTTIDNANPRKDTAGKMINAHDGGLYNFEGKWLLIGTSYGTCESFTNCSGHVGDCGWQDNNFSAYTGPTFGGPWTLASSNLIPQRPRGGANFRPKILFNKRTETYVMWFNFQPPTPNVPGSYTVATSKNMIGPFSILKEKVDVAKKLNGDFALFEDDDGSAYIAYNSDENGHNCAACHIPPCDCGFQMSVERLNGDYTGSTMVNSGWIGEATVEAPAMFKRKGVYYLLFDRLSCFGPQGSGAVVYTAPRPMGPYTARNNINRNGPFRPSQLGFIIIPAQQGFIAKVGDAYVWQGDMWNSYTDPVTHRNVKAYDYQPWLPLQFESDGNISKLVWQDEWSL
jgi:hypothetical protein